MLNKKTPLLTVDCVVFFKKSVLVIKRKYNPYKNFLALPGGFVDIGETVESACLRELKEETNLKLKLRDIKLIGVYSDPSRDIRRHTISIAFYAKLKKEKKCFAGDDADSVEFIKKWSIKKLAFDHKRIIRDAFKMYLND